MFYYWSALWINWNSISCCDHSNRNRHHWQNRRDTSPSRNSDHSCLRTWCGASSGGSNPCIPKAAQLSQQPLEIPTYQAITAFLKILTTYLKFLCIGKRRRRRYCGVSRYSSMRTRNRAPLSSSSSPPPLFSAGGLLSKTTIDHGNQKRKNRNLASSC